MSDTKMEFLLFCLLMLFLVSFVWAIDFQKNRLVAQLGLTHNVVFHVYEAVVQSDKKR